MLPQTSSATTTTTSTRQITNNNNNTSTVSSSSNSGEDMLLLLSKRMKSYSSLLSRLLYNTCGGGGRSRSRSRYDEVEEQKERERERQRRSCYNNNSCHILHNEDRQQGQGQEEEEGHNRHESQGEIIVYNNDDNNNKRNDQYKVQYTAAPPSAAAAGSSSSLVSSSSSSSINSVTRSISHQSAQPYFTSSSTTRRRRIKLLNNDDDDDDDDYTTCTDEDDDNYDTCNDDDTTNEHNLHNTDHHQQQEEEDDDLPSVNKQHHQNQNQQLSTPNVVLHSSSSSSLSDCKLLLDVYNKAVNYCTPLYDVTGIPGWISQNNNKALNGFSKLRNIKVNICDTAAAAVDGDGDGGGKLCRLDCDFPEYTVNEVYNVLYDKRDQKEWNHLVECVNFIDNNITMPAMLPNNNTKLECHALSTKYYSPIPYFKPELRELRICYTPPQTQTQTRVTGELENKEAEANIDKHFIIASSDYKPLYDLPYDKGRTATYVHLSVQMITSLPTARGGGGAAGGRGAHFTYVLDLNNIPKLLPVNTLGVHNTVKFVTCLEKELSRIYQQDNNNK